MAKGLHRLKGKQIENAKAVGLHADGGGLYLQVTSSTDGVGVRRSWVFRFTALGGRTREMGLGSLDVVGAAEARGKADAARKQIAAGIDPIEARKAARAMPSPAPQMTFKQCAEAYITDTKEHWRNEKHRAQWPSTLAKYAYPIFGERAAGDVDRHAVLQAVEPIWKTKNETASRTMNRVLTVLEWSVARGYRPDDNPAGWRPYLRKALTPRSKTHQVKHHAALAYPKLSAFMHDLRAVSGVSPRALEFTILTACRTSECLNARWSEIDLKSATWTVPAARMKSNREHVVPLSPRAIAILKQMSKRGSKELIFPGMRDNAPLSITALSQVLKRMDWGKITTHGFRSSFRTWAAEKTNAPQDVAEAALAHVIRDPVEAAYKRTDYLERRRDLMAQWAKHCTPKARNTRAANA